MTETMTGARMVVQALKDQGVEVVFGYPGGAVLPIYDEIFQQNDIRHILVRHEQGAVHMAEGYARSTGKPGVVLVTSGPGATNAVTGLTDALMDSIPIMVLTGPGADLHDRHRCLSGGRYRRHHPALHQDELAGQGHREAGRNDPSGLPCRHPRPPRPGADRHPEGRAVRRGALYPDPGRPRSAIISPRSTGDAAAIEAPGRADGERRAPGVLYRRRRGQFRPRGERGCCANWWRRPISRSPRP